MFPAIELALAQGPGDGEAFWLLGSLVTIKVPGELTGNALSVSEQLVPAGGAFPRHLHHVEDEILYVLEGEIAGSCGDQAVRAGPGGVVFLPRGVAHSWQAVGDVARLLVVTTPAGFERFCAEAGEPAPRQALPDGPVAAAAFERLRAVAPRYGLEFLSPAG